MDNSVNNKYPSYAGVNITCNVIDPTKLPPDSPLLNQPQVVQQPPTSQPVSYPANYYVNNYASPSSGPMGGYGMYPPPVNESKNTKKKRVQTITDNYIKNLESYLNSPNEDLRKFAAKEILKRFDEDKTRYNDAALNALVNKMLQDPACHQVKSTALTLLDGQLAQGNDTTVKILTNMAQTDTSRNGTDAKTAASILLKMSSPTKLVDVSTNTTSNGAPNV